MAEDRLPWRRSWSIAATRSDKVMPRPTAISLSPFQNASSRLTLVLCPAITIERLTTGDFICRLHRSGATRVDDERGHGAPLHRRVPLSCGHAWRGSARRDLLARAVRLACGPPAN